MSLVFSYILFQFFLALPYVKSQIFDVTALFVALVFPIHHEHLLIMLIAFQVHQISNLKFVFQHHVYLLMLDARVSFKRAGGNALCGKNWISLRTHCMTDYF